MQQNQPERYEFLTPVWGKKHIDLYLNICLPTQFTSRNLQYFSNRPQDVYRILTTPEDIDLLNQHPVIRRLQQMIKVEFVTPPLPSDILPNSFKMASYYEYAINESLSAGYNSAFVFLTSDSLWSEGAFQYFHKIISSGKRAVCIPHWLRLNTEEVVDSIDKHFCIDSEGKRSINSIELLRYSLKHLHNSSKAFFWDDENPWNQKFPSQFCWSIKEEGILCRCFTFHPLVVWPDRLNTKIEGALDGNFLQASITNFNKIHIAQTANDILACDLAFLDQNYGESIGSKSIWYVTEWILDATSSIHLFFSKFIIELYWKKKSHKWKINKIKSDCLMHWLNLVLFMHSLYRKYFIKKS